MYYLFTRVIWKGKDCIVTRTYPNGKMLISPMGNGELPAKYYTVTEDEIKLKEV